MSLDRLSRFLRQIKKTKDRAMSWDPSMDRYIKFGDAIDACIEPYKQLFSTLRKQQQLPITMFRKPVKRTTETPPEDLEEEDNPEEI